MYSISLKQYLIERLYTIANCQNRPLSYKPKNKKIKKQSKNTLERMRNVKQPQTRVKQLL